MSNGRDETAGRAGQWRERLVNYRQRLDLTQREVAQGAGISVSEYRQYEAGAEPLVSVALKIARVLNTGVCNVWEG